MERAGGVPGQYHFESRSSYLQDFPRRRLTMSAPRFSSSWRTLRRHDLILMLLFLGAF